MNSTTHSPVKVILDTDIGSDVDDAIALAFALLRPELDIRAVTTVYGPVAERSAIAAKILKTVGRADIPYATGDGMPLNGVRELPGTANQYPIVRPDDVLPSPACGDAQELFRRVIEASPGEVWLATIGPMTNAAVLIREHPELAAKLKGIVCMGLEPTRPLADYNIRLDAEAADIVCRSGRLKFAGTYDVTKRIMMDDGDLARLERGGTPAARILMECVGLWKPFAGKKPGPIIYDMCPLAWLFAPELFTTRPQALGVELQPPERRGITLPLPEGAAANVSTDVEVETVHRLLMDTLI